MGNFFTYDYQGTPFQLLGTAHLAALGILVLLNLFLLRDRKKCERARKRTRWTIAIILWLDESAWHIWKIASGTWNIQEGLPLHTCSLLIWLAGYMLIRKDEHIYEFAYFIGIGVLSRHFSRPILAYMAFPTSVSSRRSFPTDC